MLVQTFAAFDRPLVSIAVWAALLACIHPQQVSTVGAFESTRQVWCLPSDWPRLLQWRHRPPDSASQSDEDEKNVCELTRAIVENIYDFRQLYPAPATLVP